LRRQQHKHLRGRSEIEPKRNYSVTPLPGKNSIYDNLFSITSFWEKGNQEFSQEKLGEREQAERSAWRRTMRARKIERRGNDPRAGGGSMKLFITEYHNLQNKWELESCKGGQTHWDILR